MELFKFTGEWETEIKLRQFEPYHVSVYKPTGRQLEKRYASSFYMRIVDWYGDMSPDPTAAQLNTIDYLQQEDHQLEIINSIIKYLKDDIYPFYQANVLPKKEYPKSYPNVQTIEDFYSYFRLEAITIYYHAKDDFAYYNLTFGVNLLDDEHGICIDLHKNRCIDHGPGEGSEYLNISKELNLSSDVVNKLNQRMNSEPAILHTPHPKYNVLKPWQVDANQRFPMNAYRNKEDDLLIDFIKNKESKHTIQRYIYIYQLAKKDNRTKVLDYLRSFEYFNDK